jgi:NHLM bacteriocin system ABC transporter ATP-binding protein
LLAAYGEPVTDASVPRRLPLSSQVTLWLVADGTLNIFAAADGGRGRWRLLGEAPAGTVVPVVPASAQGPGYVLVARSTPGSRVYPLDPARLSGGPRLTAPLQHWSPGHRPPVGRGDVAALARALDGGVELLLDAIRLPQTMPGDCGRIEPGTSVEMRNGRYARPSRGIAWVWVEHGRVVTPVGECAAGQLIVLGERDWLRAASDTRLTVRDTAMIIADGSLWQSLTAHQTYLQNILGRRVAEGDRRDDERLTASRDAGDSAFLGAVRALRAPMDSSVGNAANGDDDETYAAVVRLVAGAAGITVQRPPDATDTLVSPIERIALASGFRTREIGISGTWWKSDAGPLVGQARSSGKPVALLWRRGAYDVVEPVTGDRIRMTERTAKDIGPTALMLYRPLPEDVTNPARLLRFALRGSGSDLLRLFVSGVAAVALGLFVPVMSGKVLGQFVPQGDTGLILQACLAVVLASLVAMALSVVENLSVLRTEGRFETTLQAGLWDRMLRHPAGFFTKYSSGELTSAALGITKIRQLLSGVSVVVVHSVLLALVNFALMLSYDVTLALICGALVTIGGAVLAVSGIRLGRWQRQLIELDNSLTSKVFETLLGLPKLRVAAAENFAYARWADGFARSRHLIIRVRRIQNVITVFTAAYTPLCTLVLFAMVAGPLRGAVSVAEFLTVSVAFGVQLATITQLVGGLIAAGASVPLFKQLEPILAQPPEVPRASRLPGVLGGEIEVRDVSFRYHAGAPPALDDVSLHIAPGEFVAIVGPSGCGKSTLLRLLIGFEEPADGSVLYDNQDLSALDASAVRRQCGIVLQNSQPFRGSILDNIRGAGRHALDEVREAVEMAGLTDDIAGMPMGLHTVLSDGGGTLSGGQRQRLMIAQALVRRPRILFFDEATSALDNETQRIVTESTRRLRATRVIAAHRLSTVMEADRVIVLEEGRIVQNGPPRDLLADQSGMFHRLALRQMDEGL